MPSNASFQHSVHSSSVHNKSCPILLFGTYCKMQSKKDQVENKSQNHNMFSNIICFPTLIFKVPVIRTHAFYYMLGA